MQLLRSLVLHARRLTTQQKGAGFANFLAVLTSAAASFISHGLRMRGSLQVHFPSTDSTAGAGGLPRSTGAG